jgi:predicted Zn finger-like uncharacterized protein
MSLITRCPACATMFKVVPDQLRVSEGWVRCGQCSEVFDANANLLDPAAALNPAPPLTVSHVDIEAGETVPPEEVIADATPEAEPEMAEAVEVAEAAESQQADPFLAVNPHALYIDPLEDHAAAAEPELLPEPSLARAEEEASEQPSEADAEEEINGEELHHAFLQPRTAPPPPPQRRAVRVALALLGVVLGAGLLAQVAVHERDRIVALEPATKAVLGPLCDLLGCRIAPLQQIESVVIDSSSFTKVRGDVYRLGFTLKNIAQTPLATPALELTLTDLQDQAVVRKVFAVKDFADKQTVLEPGAELPASLPVAVKLGGNGEKISGYRLLSFYP